MTSEATYKVAEVAQILRVGTNTVYRLIDAGDLDCTRVGRHIRITQTQLDDFLIGDQT